METKNVNNYPRIEKAFFIAKINNETVWGSDSSTMRGCQSKMKKLLGVHKSISLPEGATIDIIKVSVTQELTKRSV